MGRTKTSTSQLPPEHQWRPYLIEPSGPLNWSSIFANDHPIEVEVGSGKGLFLVSAATQFPRHNFIGIEISRKYAVFTAGRLAKHSLSNARIARGDARRLFTEYIPRRSVAAAHVYFPDPWWKRRHQKRRLFTEVFITALAEALIPGGILRVATDVEEYFVQIDTGIVDHGSFRRLENLPVHDPEHDFDYQTNFERKYRKAGKPIFRATYSTVFS